MLIHSTPLGGAEARPGWAAADAAPYVPAPMHEIERLLYYNSSSMNIGVAV